MLNEGSKRKLYDRIIDSGPKNQVEFCSNAISTTQYTWWSFLPVNLFTQFKKIANFYFLVISYLQTISAISISEGVPTNLYPLIFVLTVTAVKDAFEDLKRRTADQKANNSPTLIFNKQSGKWVESAWADIHVGDLVKIRDGEELPCDILLVHVPDDQGICSVETKNLDGETNLKSKQAADIMKKINGENNQINDKKLQSLDL
jgi:magnesium-transporting ATPase (P-type)